MKLGGTYLEGTFDFEDDFYKKLNTRKAYKVKEQQMDNFWVVLRNQLKDQVIQNFGIQSILSSLNLGGLSQYKEGGDVSTIHNAQEGVFVDSEHETRFNKSYNRKNYEGRKGEGIDNRLNTQRKKRFQKDGVIYDEYTGKVLNKDGSTHLDHITSAKHIHDNDKARLYMTDDERNDMAVDKHNMAAIDGRMNQSKGEMDLHEWENKEKNGQTNAERYGIDKQKTAVKEKESERFINKTVNNAAAKEFNNAARKKGMEQAKRQACGVVLYMASDIVIDELKSYIGNWNEYVNVSRRVSELKRTFERIKQRLWESIKQVKVWSGQIISAAFSGFTSGILGTLVTTIVNSLTTTVSAWGKILQDGLSTFIEGFKTLITNPSKLPWDKLVKSVVKMIGVGLGTTVGLVVGESFNEKLSKIPGLPKFLIDAISTVVGAMVSGFLCAIVITSVDNFGQIIKKFNSTWDGIMSNTRISIKQVEATYHQALQNIDESYRAILEEIEKEYERMGQLSKLAHDMTMLASDQLFASVNYAKVSGVAESRILHTNSEVEKYFLGGK